MKKKTIQHVQLLTEFSFVRNFSQFAVVYFRFRDFGQVAAAAAVALATHWHK